LLARVLRRLTLAAIAATALTAAALPAVALAGPPGSWTQVSSGGNSNILQVGLARTADGVLHVAWRRQSGSNQDLVHTPISAGGAQGSPTAIVTGFVSLENPALVTEGSGLRTFFGGIRTTSPGESNQNMNTATSADGGASWTLTIGTVVTGGSAYSAPTSAALAPGGVPFQAWGGTFVHRGLSAGDPNTDVQALLGGCCGYDPNIGFDAATGAGTVAWYSNATGKPGVWAEAIDPATGAAVGAPVNVPGTVTGSSSSQQLSRTPLAVRPGGGIFIAYPGGYPTTTSVLVWRVGAGSATTLDSSGANHSNVAVAAGPDGRVWAVWTQSTSGALRVYARRSNPAATAWEPTFSVPAPAGATTAYRLDASAQSDRLDVLGHFDVSSSIETWHTQLVPGGASGTTKTTTTIVDDQLISFFSPNACVKLGKKFGVKVTAKPYRIFRGHHPHATFRKVQFLVDGKVKATRTRKPYAATLSTRGLRRGRHSVWARMVLNRHFPNGRNVKLTKTLKATFSIC
jgi:hypothetical protein